MNSRDALSRKFMDEGLIEWEAYVSGGQPDTPAAARIYFVCLEDPFARPRWVGHESGSVAEATRALTAMTNADLSGLLAESTPLD
ncbi:MAG: hypothetical protein OEU54_08995 [Gemmatimonadota bacterium]|nr:hypothetical protein [Gemmatimonadota bacterium]